jgi:selenocysteine lyase/cysteine desulfurase
LKLSRREILLAGSALALVSQGDAALPPDALPDKNSFRIQGITYLDSGSQHPMSIDARFAVQSYMVKRALDFGWQKYSLPDEEVRKKFAHLINAEPDEIAYVQSTTAGEQMILRGLALPESGGHVVTDTLHFFGSIPLYEEMERRGVKVSWVKARDGRIRLEDMKRAITPGTKLISLSLVSTINGFQHDLKAVCDLAHANGALVYADIIHAAGAVPLDVKETGVDFAACASYKWLMGDFGLGFIFARKASRAHLRRTEYGYYGLGKFEPHIYPFDPPGESAADYEYEDSSEGFFAHGTHAHTVIAQLNRSLDYIDRLGVATIQAHAQSLTDHLKEELPKLGYTVITPLESRTPIVACALQDAQTKLKSLADKGFRITVSKNRFRLTPSVFNDHVDIERFLSAIGRA